MLRHTRVPLFGPCGVPSSSGFLKHILAFLVKLIINIELQGFLKVVVCVINGAFRNYVVKEGGHEQEKVEKDCFKGIQCK
jgi:hypothetical protein